MTIQSKLNEMQLKPYTYRKYWLSEIGPGWYNEVTYLLKQLQELGGNLQQVKEKFGGLRFYYHLDNDPHDNFCKLVDSTEDNSFIICEDCGIRGKLRNLKGRMWLKTLCDYCWEQS